MYLNLFNFVIAALAVWRLSSLFANEDGPFDVFKRLRAFCAGLCSQNRFFGAFRLSEGLECEWCNSVWFGSIVSGLCFGFTPVVQWAVLTLALSTVAIGLKYIIQTLEQIREYAERLNNRPAIPDDYQPVLRDQYELVIK